jgi:hypothetical protein
MVWTPWFDRAVHLQRSVPNIDRNGYKTINTESLRCWTCNSPWNTVTSASPPVSHPNDFERWRNKVRVASTEWCYKERKMNVFGYVSVKKLKQAMEWPTNHQGARRLNFDRPSGILCYETVWCAKSILIASLAHSGRYSFFSLDRRWSSPVVSKPRRHSGTYLLARLANLPCYF